MKYHLMASLRSQMPSPQGTIETDDYHAALAAAQEKADIIIDSLSQEDLDKLAKEYQLDPFQQLDPYRYVHYFALPFDEESWRFEYGGKPVPVPPGTMKYIYLNRTSDTHSYLETYYPYRYADTIEKHYDRVDSYWERKIRRNRDDFPFSHYILPKTVFREHCRLDNLQRFIPNSLGEIKNRRIPTDMRRVQRAVQPVRTEESSVRRPTNN